MRNPSVLPPGMKLVGEVQGDDDLVVLGSIQGEIRINGDLLIETSGAVKGDVHARNVTVRGAVVGDAFGESSVRVEPGARMVGDATAPRVNIVEGALFRGRIHMGDNEPRRTRMRRPGQTAAGTSSPGSVEATSSHGTVAGRTAPGLLVTPPTEAGAPSPAGEPPAAPETRDLRPTRLAGALHPTSPPVPRIPGVHRTRARRKSNG